MNTSKQGTQRKPQHTAGKGLTTRKGAGDKYRPKGYSLEDCRSSIIKALTEGRDLETIAKEAGVTQSALFYWREKYPEFKRQWDEAKEEAKCLGNIGSEIIKHRTAIVEGLKQGKTYRQIEQERGLKKGKTADWRRNSHPFYLETEEAYQIGQAERQAERARKSLTKARTKLIVRKAEATKRESKVKDKEEQALELAREHSQRTERRRTSYSYKPAKAHEDPEDRRRRSIIQGQEHSRQIAQDVKEGTLIPYRVSNKLTIYLTPEQAEKRRKQDEAQRAKEQTEQARKSTRKA